MNFDRCPICKSEIGMRVFYQDTNLMMTPPRQKERYVKVTSWQCLAIEYHHGIDREPSEIGEIRNV